LVEGGSDGNEASGMKGRKEMEMDEMRWGRMGAREQDGWMRVLLEAKGSNGNATCSRSPFQKKKKKNRKTV